MSQIFATDWNSLLAEYWKTSFVCYLFVCFERHPRVECLFALVGVETIVNQVVAALHTILTILTHIRGKLGISISHFHNVTNNSKVFLIRIGKLIIL